MTSLYIHIPFCKRKCDYCSFYSLTYDYKEEYVGAIIQAVKKYGGKSLKSIYVGGGTPSVLSPSQIARITDAVYKYNNVSDCLEFTVECNPESISADFLKASGAGRVSMGFQSFCDKELKAVGRLHTADDCKRAVEICREADIKNISGDLIFALPYQTVSSLENSISQMISLDIEHISVYNLQLEEGTRVLSLSDRVADEDTQAKMYYTVCGRLKDAGFCHYEISNFAKEGYRAVHNSVYWEGGDYIGLGPSAHSKIGNMRYFFDADIHKFINGSFEFDGSEEISDPLFEKIMLGLRTDVGVDTRLLKNSSAFIKQLVSGGFATVTDNRLVLTDRGFYLSNTIIAEITAKEC